MKRLKLEYILKYGDRCDIRESYIGEYAVCRGDNQIWYSEIGKFVAIAYGARINAVNHPSFTRLFLITQFKKTLILTLPKILKLLDK